MRRSRVAVLMGVVCLVPGLWLAEVPAGVAAAGPVTDADPGRAAGSSLTVESFNDYGPVSGTGTAPGETVIPVAGMPSTITDLSVYLRGLSARNLGLAKITIVTPDGTAVDLIEDACEGSTAPVSAKDFVVDDRATSPLPHSAADTTAACWSSRDMIQPSDHFPSQPTPLAALNGHPANGGWKILVSSDGGAELVGLSDGFGFILAADDPDTALTGGPGNGEQSGSSVSFGFGSPNMSGAGFECSLDGQPFAACGSPHPLAGLTAGAHDFRVRAATPGGVDPTPAQVVWVVRPETQIVSAPVAVSGSSVSFGFRAPNAAGAAFECRVDGSAFSTCASPFPVRNLKAGSHTFRVRARISAGGVVVVDPTPAQTGWTVVPPNTRIITHPTRRTTKRRARFAFTATEPGSRFRCQLDHRRWRACASPKVLRVKPGRHVFRVRAIDPAGNRDQTPAKVVWRRIRG